MTGTEVTGNRLLEGMRQMRRRARARAVDPVHPRAPLDISSAQPWPEDLPTEEPEQ